MATCTHWIVTASASALRDMVPLPPAVSSRKRLMRFSAKLSVLAGASAGESTEEEDSESLRRTC